MWRGFDTSTTLVRSTWRTAFHSKARPALAFAFDIDGVLCHGRTPLPHAARALRFLDGGNSLGLRIPFILVTNGGGVSEADKAQSLSDILRFPISHEHVIQAHTVLKEIAFKYKHDKVLVLGGEPGIENVARDYGFHNVETSYSLLESCPGSTSDERAKGTRGVADRGIRAILVFHDPRDWGRDIQLMLDAVLPGFSVNDSKPYSSVDVVFCNPDVLWKAQYPIPRLGQGAFANAFQGVFKAITGVDCPNTQVGKPTKATFDYAHNVLRAQLGQGAWSGLDPRQIYMIGDNVASDIAGANAAGWSSVLVRTGVYDPREAASAALKERHPPTHEAEDVEEAVKWAYAREIT